MQNKEMRLGSITLLFVVAVMCVTALCVLNFATAHADNAVAGKYAGQVDAYYETECAGQEWLAAVDAALAEKGTALLPGDLPAGTEIAEDTLTVTLDTGNGRALDIVLRMEPEAENRWQILQWKNAALWQEDDTIGSLWMGNTD